MLCIPQKKVFVEKEITRNFSVFNLVILEVFQQVFPVSTPKMHYIESTLSRNKPITDSVLLLC